MTHKRRIQTHCPSCDTDWKLYEPADTCQMICMPDEHTYLWWECPDCGWQMLKLYSLMSIEACVGIGIPWFDWSDIEPDPAPPCTLVEESHMIQVGEMDSNRAGIIMLAAAERILHESNR